MGPYSLDRFNEGEMMMYHNRFVVAVKHNGKVLRHVKQSGSDLTDTVLIPLGAEYSLFFKNLKSVRALVRVEIDGVDATRGTSLIVPANGSVELERFLEAGQLSEGHRFKFIERTSKIENGPRGIKAEDGLIRVEFEFEQQPAKIEPAIYRSPIWYSNQTTWTTTPVVGSPLRSMSITEPQVTFGTTSIVTSNAASTDAVVAQASVTGITVQGSRSNQQFQTGQWFPTDGQKHVMVLRLLGEVGGKKIEQPVTVKTKQICPTCGTKNRMDTKFCRECGTGLML